MSFKRARRAQRSAALRASAAMLVEMIYFAPPCPACGRRHAIPLIRERVAMALLQHEAIVLYSPCHNREWQAAPAERRELEELAFEPLPDAAPAVGAKPFGPAALMSFATLLPGR